MMEVPIPIGRNIWHNLASRVIMEHLACGISCGGKLGSISAVNTQ